MKGQLNARMPGLRATRRLGTGGGSILLTPPAGLGWTPSWSVRKTGDTYDIVGLDFDALKPAAGYTYYGSPAGNASGSPADNDPAAPVTPRRFRDLANTHAGNELLRIAGGRYYGNIGLDGQNLTCPGVIIEPWVGQGSSRQTFIKRASNAVATWSADTGATYFTAHTAAGTPVFDLKTIPASGLIPRLVEAGSLAACRSTPGTYFYDSGASRMYVTASDSRSLIGDLDMIVISAGRSFNALRTDDQTVWLDNMDFLGGLYIGQNTSGKLTTFNARNVGVFGGSNGIAIEGRVDVILLSPRIGGGTSDGMNYHGSAGGNVRVLEYDARTYRSGYDASAANNATTLHESCKAIRVAGDYAGSQDRTLHDINASKSWNVGCTFRPGVNGPATVCAGVADGETTEIWLDGCTIVPGSTYDLFAYAGSTIRCTNMPNFASLVKGGSGTIVQY